MYYQEMRYVLLKYKNIVTENNNKHKYCWHLQTRNVFRYIPTISWYNFMNLIYYTIIQNLI